MTTPEILTMDEVQAIAVSPLAHQVPDVARLCATASYWHDRAGSNEAFFEDAQRARVKALALVEEQAAEIRRLEDRLEVLTEPTWGDVDNS